MQNVISDRRQHPIAIIHYTYRYLFLLLVPLLRGLRYIRTPQGLYLWLKGTWIDVLAVLVLVLLPLVAWGRHSYSLTDRGFIIRRGIFLRTTSFIPRHSIATLSVERPFYLRPLRAVRIAIDTDAGSSVRADFSLTVSEKCAREILNERRQGVHEIMHTFRPRWYDVALLSLLMSDSFSGIVLLATTFQQTGRLLGEGFNDRVLGNLETVAGYMTVIPTTAAILALVLIVGWCIAAIRNLLRHLPFCVTRARGTLTIRTGVLVRRDYSCRTDAINFVDYRQSVFSKFLRLHLVFINCIGYGKGKNAMPVLIPASPVKSSEEEVKQLLPEFRRHTVTLKAAPFSVYRYVFYPLWATVLLYPVSHIVQGWLPEWQELIYYLTFMAYIPCLWQMLVKIIDRCTAGIAHADGFYTLRFSRFYTFHTIMVPEDKVVAYDLKQTIFQKIVHNCDVLVYTYNEGRRYHRIRNLSMAKARAVFEGVPCGAPTDK